MGSGLRRAHLIELIQARGLSVRHLLRETDTPYTELGLADEKWSGDELIDLMVAHPILINRPIVETPLGVRLCPPWQGSSSSCQTPTLAPSSRKTARSF